MSEPYEDIGEVVIRLKQVIENWEGDSDVLADSACRIARNMLKVLNIKVPKK